MLAFPPRYVVGGDGRAIVLYAVFDHFSGGDTVSCANLLVMRRSNCSDPIPPPGTPGDITFFVVAPGFLSP